METKKKSKPNTGDHAGFEQNTGDWGDEIFLGARNFGSSVLRIDV